MADFLSHQTDLTAARSALDQAQLAVLKATARAQMAQAALDAATRSSTRQKPDGQNLTQLAAAAKHALAERDQAKTGVQQARASLAAVSSRFAEFTDPRRNVARLSDASPFLLFPVRIETRFRTFAAQGQPGIAVQAPRHQLWVRIYPDDCSIDTFEPMLSQGELTNAKNYWLGLWSAGDVESDERGAWARLVAAHGSGRSGWLIDNFKPTNQGDKPAKIDTTDEILVIPATADLNAADITPLTTYWSASWLADGDPAKLASARAALEAAVGKAHAAELVSGYVPFNFANKPAAPLTKADIRVTTAVVIFPPDPDTTVHSWTQAPQVRQFPDRFVVLGFTNNTQTLEAVGGPVTLPLYAGPDPSSGPDETIRPSGADHKGPDLIVPDELKWMVDFEAALAAGMALAIDLTPEQAAAGFDTLIVLGLQLSTPGESGPAALQELLHHHQIGRSGFALLPQGTTAHNSAGAGAGYTRADDPNSSFDDRKNLPLFTPVADPLQKRDGQWLSEFLGLDPAFVASVHGSDGKDQLQARAMQTALWPATFGYWMNTLFTPSGGTASIFSDETIELTRTFFSQYVSGRGALPAIRIGGQPYGILPTTAFSQIHWYDGQAPRANATEQAFLGNLYSILHKLDKGWADMAAQAPWVGDGGDPHQTLLNVLAHYPSSVEYYTRTAESMDQLYNMLSIWGIARNWWQKEIASENILQKQAAQVLQDLGYAGANLPDLLNHFFLTDSPRITTVIDDVPLSETNPIRVYTTAGENYIQWLIKAVSTFNVLLQETGFIGDKSPQALLYLYLRHALMLGYYDSSYDFHRNTGVLDAAGLLSMRREQPFIHVAATATTSESRLAFLYKPEKTITGSDTQLLTEFISSRIGITRETVVLTAQLNALKVLQDASTSQLERLFAEHIDTCSYRFDSWLLGLLRQRMESQRQSAGAAGQPAKRGLYLGAYAWVEHLKPAPATTLAQVPADLAKQFPGDEPLLNDPAGGGYIHAPSMTHADTAAVLRSGYMASVKSGPPGPMAVNLSSDRVRTAMTLIEGIRNGQSLGALLGYRFERGLHDSYAAVEVDKFIYPLRKAFPLAADAMADTKTDPNVPIEAIDARNVVDGKKLADWVQKSATTYPWGRTDLPAAEPTKEQPALDNQAQALVEACDAVADLALAEGVHQAVQGNYDRVASTMEAYATGNFPPEPEVAQTPPTGTGLTHRLAVQFKPGLGSPAGATPRAVAEPAVDEWLERMLPPLSQIGCKVEWKDPVSGDQHLPVTLADLDLRPLDLLSLAKPDQQQAMAELDDRILRYTIATRSPRWDAPLQIQYLDAGGAKFSVFEFGPMLREVRALVTQARPLRASDVRRANDASQDDNAQVFADPARINTPLGDLKTLGSDIDTFLTPLALQLQDTKANRAPIIANVDVLLAKAVGFLERGARFGLPSSGWGFAYSWLQTAFNDLLKQTSALTTRWQEKLDDFKNALTAYAALPAGTSAAARFAALQAAELIISTALDPLPATPNDLLLALNGKRTNFENRLTAFTTILANPGTSFSGFLNSLAALSTTEFDSQPFDLSGFGDRAVAVTGDVFRTLTGQSSTIADRGKNVQTLMTSADAATSAADKVAAIQNAAKALFGDDFLLVPEFTVTADQGGEWANAITASTSDALFDYLKNTLNVDFPVDEWMYSAARVRPRLHSWEAVVMLQEAFSLTAQKLTPIQLPYVAGDPWLALDFPETYTIDSDRLLYTCAYSVTFAAGDRQCGLLLDEWTEVIPTKQRDTAITFNYQRPDNEPPQAMLLVTSAANTGAWQWDDLVTALLDTLALAKKRAVEPAIMDPLVYSRFLPATVIASTTYGITIATPLAAANGVMEAVKEGAHA